MTSNNGTPGGTHEWLLFADRVIKTYPDGDVHALNGVSLGVRPAQYVAITGPSGCGKSTLMNMLGVLDVPDAGEVYFKGEPLSKRRDLDHFRARQIGFVFQSFYLIPTLTARENVQVPMFEGPPLPARERSKKADELLDLVGMGKRADHRPQKLSVGERQRVALARALANDPPLLLADEPTGNLDRESADHVMDLVRTINQTMGSSFLISTHDEHIAARCQRRIELLDGRIVRS